MMRNTGGILPKVTDGKALDVFADLYDIYTEISGQRSPHVAADKIVNDLVFVVFVRQLKLRRQRDCFSDQPPKILEQAREPYKDFEGWGKDNVPGFLTSRFDKNSGKKKETFSVSKWRTSSRFLTDIEIYLDSLEEDDATDRTAGAEIGLLSPDLNAIDPKCGASDGTEPL